LKGRDHYLYFTIGCTVIALGSIGMTYFFPFRENKSNKSQIMANSFTDSKLDLSEPDYNPHSYHGNPKNGNLMKSTNEEPLLDSSEEDDVKKEKKTKKDGKNQNKEQTIDDTTLSFE
jgi:hypothetical protein